MTAVYAAVEAIVAATTFATATVCDVLDVCRSAYYAWHDRAPTTREHEAEELQLMITAIFWQHRRRYGARRIAEELSDRGIVCSP